jgi:transposase
MNEASGSSATASAWAGPAGRRRRCWAARRTRFFVGHEAAGENLAGLYALVATCEANGVNPEEYLADVLLRVQTHPYSRIGELLPHEWMRRRAADSS